MNKSLEMRIDDRFVRNGSPLYFPSNAFELFSFVIEGRSFALGAQPGVGGRFVSDEQVTGPKILVDARTLRDGWRPSGSRR